MIIVAELNPDRIIPYFKSIQSVFYIEQTDVTKADRLGELATQQAGARCFPSLVLQQDSGVEFITRGYRPLDAITSQIESWLI